MIAVRKFLKQNNDMVVSGLALMFTLSLLLAVYLDSGSSSRMTSTLASGLYQGMLYFMVAAGLSIVFGLMDVLNFAQGSLFMVGAYTGFEVLTSLPRHATADQRLILIFVIVNAPVIFLVLESLVLTLLRKYAQFSPYPTTGSFWEKLAVVALLGVGLGFGVGTFSNGAAVQLVLAVAIGIIALLDPLRETVLFGLRYVGEGLGFLYERGWHTLNTQFINLASTQTPPQRQFPQWQRPAMPTPQGLIGVGVGAVSIALLALWFADVDVRVIHLGIAGAAAIFAGAVAGVLMERLFIRPTYSRPFFQVILTFGLALVIREAVIWRYEFVPVGTLRNFLPASLTGRIEGTSIYNYWVFMIVMGLIMMIGVQLLLKRTRIGIIIRAGVQDSEMVEALGINVRLVFTVVFALGAAIAALGGVISGGFLNIDPAMGDAFLLQAIAVVIIGGLGSYGGTAIASIMLGISRQVASYFSRQYYNTDGLAPIVVLSLLCLILIVKPSGLFGKEH